KRAHHYGLSSLRSVLPLMLLHPPMQKGKSAPRRMQIWSLHQAITLVQISSLGQRPMICFLCVGNPGLLMEKRTRKYSTPGSLSRHVRQTHVRPCWPEGRTIKCNICRVELENKRHLMHHAESVHGTVSRVPP
ncbi:hypothetical protein T310_6180, partial [Rasamsonia emersonii CBS 393.64]